MYDEFISKYTADHLRTHINAYLSTVNNSLPTQIKLATPKSIESASVVGGLFTTFDEILPQYGIDIMGKTFIPEGRDLYTFEYLGQINGLVHAGSQQEVDKQVKRHSAAVELFVRNHQFLHQYVETNYFQLLEFTFLTVEWSGGEELPEVDGRSQWMAGFSMNVAWLLSEEGPGQHG